jgi:hypothetical protein
MAEVYYSNNPVDWAAVDGLYIDEVAAPEPLSVGGAGVVGCVGEFPWGPVNVPYLIGDAATLVRLYFGYESDLDYLYGDPDDPSTKPGYKGCIALAGKRWSSRGFWVVRVSHSAQAASDADLDDTATPAKKALTLTAKYVGKLGDRIQYKVTNDTGTVDLQIRWGNRTETYEGFATTEALVAAINSGSDLVTATDGEAGHVLPKTVSDWTPLSGGSDGTPAAADYSGSDVSKVGFRCFAPDVELMFACEFADTTLDTAMDTWLKARGYGVFFAGMDVGDDLSDAETAAEAVNTEPCRVRVCWPALKYVTPDGRTRDTMSNAWQCAAAARISPHRDLAAAGTKGSYAGVVGLETDVQITRAEYIEAAQNGVGAMEQLASGGYKARSGILADGSLLLERRMADLIHNQEAVLLEPFQNEPMDDEWKEGLRGILSRYLQYLKDAPRKMAKDFSLDDTSLNTESSEGAGEWHVKQKVKLYPPGRYIILHSQVGTTVTITTQTSGA